MTRKSCAVGMRNAIPRNYLKSLRLLRFSSAPLSSEERLENVVLRLKLSLLMSWRHFLLKKSKEVNWPSGGVHFDFRVWTVSKMSLFEVLESSSLSWKIALSWTRRRNFSTSCLTENSSSFLDVGTKFNPLQRTDFSASESERFSGIVTTVLRLSSDESQVIGGPVNCSNFWALIWCKWLKSLELTFWILVRIGSDCRIPRPSHYKCRCALKNEVYNNRCYSYSMRCK